MRLMADLQRASRALIKSTGCVKLNYEIHGNTIPHLHVHLFPRFPGDSFEGRPIDPTPTGSPVYGPGEHERFVTSLRAQLALTAA